MKHESKIIFFAILIINACCSAEKPLYDNAYDNAEEIQPEAALRSAPFSKGVNFSGWFESFSTGGIPFTKYTEQDFADVKSLGVDVIRLPVKMHSMTQGEPHYTIDPLLFKFLDIAIGWAEKYEIYIIIDNHSFDPVLGLEDNIDRILLPIWSQVAQRYKDRSDYIVYEILNEPHGISDARWGEVQEMAIQAIRRIDQRHAIIVGGTDFNSIGKLSAIPEYSDPNLIYTFHFYDPFLFTHQGASWGGPPVLTSLAGVPFPADHRRMPRVPSELMGTWVEDSLKYYYANDAAYSKLSSTLDIAVAFSRERDVPVFCGEFGVYMINSHPEDRIKWYEFVSRALDRRNISRASWDYYGGFGIFNSGNGNFNYDLNIELVSAMGFTAPEQIKRSLGPLNTGFVIFDDYPHRSCATAGYWDDANSTFSLYDTNSARGEFAILWGNVNQYNIFWFSFDNGGDFSYLASEGYCLEFLARTDKPVKFDVRFMNQESARSIPWRMRYTIDENILPPDGNWHVIRIPLAGMSEHGAWINSTQRWINPRGEFSWRDVRQLEFVSEHMDMKDIYVRFDEIKISK
jgi:endoglucanase